MNSKNPSFFAVAVALPAAAIAIVLTLTGCATIPPSTPGIDDDAKEILQQTSDTIAAAKSFSFRVQRDVAEKIAEASGMTRQADIRVTSARPNKVMAVRGSGASEARFYYDGAKITRYDTSTNAYAVADAPATSDAMIAFLKEKWGIRPPLAGLLLSKPFESAIQKATSGKIAGEETIDGEPCIQLVFTGDGVIWDLWISTQDHLPRRFDVTITELKGSPKGVTMISEWDLDAKFAGDHFKAKIPSGAALRDMGDMP